MAYVRTSQDAASGQDHEPALETQEARQADGEKENLRILDRSLPLAILALAVIGIYVAALAAT
jgi:hypothetical protein